LPAAPSDFSAAIAEKSFVNDATEMLGAAADADDDAAADVVAEELEELELEDELPQAATPTLAVTASAAITDLLFSKCTCTSSYYVNNNRGTDTPLTARSATVAVMESRLNARFAGVNEALTSRPRT